MVNRKNAPELVMIDHVDFVAPMKHEISKDVFLFHMKDVTNETSRFDLYFDAGKCRGSKGIPAFVNGLLLSGTKDKTSVQIQSEINSLGGFIETGVSAESAVISIYALRENLIAILEIVMDSIRNLGFIQDEVEEYLQDRKQKLLISEEKVGYLAQKEFQQKLFASNDIYGIPLNIKDFDDATIDQMKAFHKENYLKGLQRIVVVGDFEEEQVKKVIDLTSPITIKSTDPFDSSLAHEPGTQYFEKKDALQSAIRVGRILFNKNHDDYLDFTVLNTILGDYFGSRLMSNIREDKGYTYGIGSMVAELNNTGYFMIATEVGKEVREDAIREIRNEIERIQNELVPQEELDLVKNYIRGQLLKSADGPYAMTDLFLSVELHGKDMEFYNQALEKLVKITPERIQELAKKYLNWDDLAIVSAG
jgi:predicted Zn-dependent peptidase